MPNLSITIRDCFIAVQCEEGRDGTPELQLKRAELLVMKEELTLQNMVHGTGFRGITAEGVEGVMVLRVDHRELVDCNATLWSTQHDDGRVARVSSERGPRRHAHPFCTGLSGDAHDGTELRPACHVDRHLVHGVLAHGRTR